MRSIVFSTVSHLDMYTGEDRKGRWRPLLELLRIHGFKVDKLYFFISHLYRHIVPTLVKDMNNVCPETEIVPVITDLYGCSRRACCKAGCRAGARRGCRSCPARC